MIRAVLSDIHGNYIALDRCVEHALASGAREFVFLGDYIGEFPYPERTMERLYRLAQGYPCAFVRGNKEDYWINRRAGRGAAWRTGSTTGALLYAYERLKDRDIDFFEAMPVCLRISPDILACHGTPEKNNGKMLAGDEATLKLMEQSPARLILFGHTHRQYDILHAGRRAVNPGAVGVPLGSQGRTQYMLLDGMKTEFVSLEYDREIVLREMKQSGLMRMAPGWTRATEHLVATGEVSNKATLDRVMDICREKYGSCQWPDIPEACWDQAIEELFGEGGQGK